MHIDKLEWVATIDVKKRMESYLANMEIASGSHIQMTDKLREELTAFYEKPLKKLEKNEKYRNADMLERWCWNLGQIEAKEARKLGEKWTCQENDVKVFEK